MRSRNKVTLIVTAFTLVGIVIAMARPQAPRSSGATVHGLCLGMTRGAIEAILPKTLVATQDSVTFLTGNEKAATVAVHFHQGLADKITGSRLEVGTEVLQRDMPQSDLWRKLGTPTWKGVNYAAGDTQYSLWRYERFKVSVRCSKGEKVEWFELLDQDDRIQGLTRE